MYSDKELIRQILRRGSEKALLQLVRRHEASVFNLAVRILGDAERAEEVAQDAFLKSFAGLKQLAAPNKYKAWLLKITYHKALDVMRKKKPPVVNMDGYFSDERLKIKTTESPLQALQQAELKVVVAELLKELPTLDRTLLTLYYLEEYSIAEVADTVQLTPSNVKIRLMRARTWLRKRLKRAKYPGQEDLY